MRLLLRLILGLVQSGVSLLNYFVDENGDRLTDENGDRLGE